MRIDWRFGYRLFARKERRGRREVRASQIGNALQRHACGAIVSATRQIRAVAVKRRGCSAVTSVTLAHPLGLQKGGTPPINCFSRTPSPYFDIVEHSTLVRREFCVIKSRLGERKMAIHIKDKDDFASKLSDAGDQLVVVDFFATWCGPCKMIGPKLEDLAKEFKNILVLKVDVDECEDIAMEYNITSMPTFVFIKQKEVVTQFSGANFDKLKQTVAEHK